MALIEFKNVNKYYGDYHALRDINLEIEKGQVCGSLGPFWIREIYPYPYNQCLGIKSITVHLSLMDIM